MIQQEIIKHYKELEDREQSYIVEIQKMMVENKELREENERLREERKHGKECKEN